MNNPQIVNVPKNQWTLVAAGIQNGFVDVKVSSPDVYLYSYRIAGSEAPTDPAEGVASNGTQIRIASPKPIDVYIYADEYDGQVIVSNGIGSNFISDYEGRQVGIDTIHQLVHEGRMFGFYVEDTDIDNNESLNLLIKTGAKSLHVIFDLEALGGQVIARIFEGSTVSANGAVVPIVAFNRVSVTTAISTVFLAPTITGDGTQILQRRVLAHAQGVSKINSAIRNDIERILKPNTNYILRITGAADNIASTLSASFYEV